MGTDRKDRQPAEEKQDLDHLGSYFGRLTERESDTSDTAIQLDQLPIAKSCSKCVFLVPFDRKPDLDGESAVDGLDPNVHRCASRASAVDVEFGESNTPVAFTFHGAADADDYLQVRLTASDGPLGTKDHAIAFEGAPLDASRSIVHLTFSQRFGVAARIAMAAYFNTVGRSKVGFTIVDRDGSGRPVYVRDLRGGVERNLMRYYLGIVAYLDSLSAPPEQRADRRVRTWLALTERYPLQLREGGDYLERKSPDVLRQQAGN